MTARRAGLRVDGKLTLARGPVRLGVRAAGQTLDVSLPAPWHWAGIFRDAPGVLGPELERVLRSLRLRVRLRWGPLTVRTLGRDS